MKYQIICIYCHGDWATDEHDDPQDAKDEWYKHLEESEYCGQLFDQDHESDGTEDEEESFDWDYDPNYADWLTEVDRGDCFG